MAPVLRQKNVLLADGSTTLPVLVWDVAGDGSGGYTAAYSLLDAAGAEVLGQVAASPASNTIGDRLKTIAGQAFAKGTAGVPSSDVVSVQGLAGGTPIPVALESAEITVNGVAVTPTTAKINIAGATTTTVIALVAAKKIRILACYLVLGGANNVNWQSHTTTSNGDSPLTFPAAGSGLCLPFNPLGWFDTTAGEALDIVTSTSAQLSGRIVYVVV